MVVAIDGPGGVGKSTVTRAVAARFGLPALDTGATYRAATLAVLQSTVDIEDDEAVVACVRNADIDLSEDRVWLDGRDVSTAVRSADVTAAVSAVSAIPEVRTIIVDLQRAWVRRRGGVAVVEGRDIGTVVFPDAEVKVFLTARPEVRASRRARDREAGGRSLDEIEADLARRDAADSNRAVSPLHPADDATVVDTSDLDVDQVVDVVVRLVADAMRARNQRPL